MPGGEKGGKEGKFGGGNGVEEGLTRGAGGATMTGMWLSCFLSSFRENSALVGEMVGRRPGLPGERAPGLEAVSRG